MRSSKWSGIALLAGWFVFVPSLSHAATITGTVQGPDGGALLKGAFVEAQNTKTKITVDVLSNKDGRYRVEKLPAGQYEVMIRAIGYQADSRKNYSSHQ